MCVFFFFCHSSSTGSLYFFAISTNRTFPTYYSQPSIENMFNGLIHRHYHHFGDSDTTREVSGCEKLTKIFPMIMEDYDCNFNRIFTFFTRNLAAESIARYFQVEFVWFQQCEL